jgi:uncharacterized membrane protein
MKMRGKRAFLGNYWACVGVAFVLTLLVAGGGALTSTTPIDSAAPSAIHLSGRQLLIVEMAFAGVVLASLAFDLLVKVFVTNPVEVGCARFFKRNLDGSGTRLTTLAEGFGDYGHVVATLLLRDLFVLLWTLLLVVPGIVKSYSWRLVPYIVKDEPDLSPLETLRRSEELMRNNRWKAFVLDLSFLGWTILGILTLGLGLVFWTGPYVHSTNAALYEELARR